GRPHTSAMDGKGASSPRATAQHCPTPSLLPVSSIPALSNSEPCRYPSDDEAALQECCLSFSASSDWGLVSPSLTALRKPLMAPPMSLPSPRRRLVPNSMITISRMITSCQILMPIISIYSVTNYDPAAMAGWLLVQVSASRHASWCRACCPDPAYLSYHR